MTQAKQENSLLGSENIHLNYGGKSTYGNFDTHFFEGQDEIRDDGLLNLRKSYRKQSQYSDFLPTWDPAEKYPPSEFFKYEDPDLRADSRFFSLFPEEQGKAITIKKLTPKPGTEVTGIQLSALFGAGEDKLALLVAQKDVVVFRNQDFATKEQPTQHSLVDTLEDFTFIKLVGIQKKYLNYILSSEDLIIMSSRGFSATPILLWDGLRTWCRWRWRYFVCWYHRGF